MAIYTVTTNLNTQLFSGHTLGEWRNQGAFAVIKYNGAVISWGDSYYGGDSSSVADQLAGVIDVQQIFTTNFAFAALRSDGSVVAWGHDAYGGYISSENALKLDGTIDVTHIFSTGYAFAALRTDGSVVTWGENYYGNYGGDSSSVASQLDGTIDAQDVTQIFSTQTAFAALRADGSVVTWGNNLSGGDKKVYDNADTLVPNSSVDVELNGSIDVNQVFSTENAFAALRADGSVVTWGKESNGGAKAVYNDSNTLIAGSSVKSKLNGLDDAVDVEQVFSTAEAFAALRKDGSVITWGLSYVGGDSSLVAAQLDGGIDDTLLDSSVVNTTLDVKQIFSNNYAFAALRNDGSVVTWGLDYNGGDSSNVAHELNGEIDVKQIFSSEYAFAALRVDGSVVTWGHTYGGGDSSLVKSQLNGDIPVTQVFSTRDAFAALRVDGSVVTWGEPNSGGNSQYVANELNGTTAITQIFSNDYAFSALRSDGSIVTWGDYSLGGDTRNIANELAAEVVSAANPYTNDVYSATYTINSYVNPVLFSGHTLGEWRNWSAFAAIKADGSVVTWGKSYEGGDSTSVEKQLDGSIDVAQIFSADYAFSALRVDGSVISWGSGSYGGDNSAVASQLDGTIDVRQVFSSKYAFAALRADGSVVSWGDSFYGGNTNVYDDKNVFVEGSSVATQLNGTVDVKEIFSSFGAFAALRVDGSVVTWGLGSAGGNSTSVASNLDGTIDVVNVFSTERAFAALRTDGSVVTWGDSSHGGETAIYNSSNIAVANSSVQSGLNGVIPVTEISSNQGAFAALRSDGSVVTWGNITNGSDSSLVANELKGLNDAVDIKHLVSTTYAFAALRMDGSVIAWGNYAVIDNATAKKLDGGVNDAVLDPSPDSRHDVKQIFATASNFAALREDGSVVTWGTVSSSNNNEGGDSSAVAAQLDGTIDVQQIFSTDTAFAALRVDGSVVTWGNITGGGKSSFLANQLNGTVDVVQIFSTKSAFAALRADGSIVSWGDGSNGGNNSAVADKLTSDVVNAANIFTNDVFTGISHSNSGIAGVANLLLPNGEEDKVYTIKAADLLWGYTDPDNADILTVNQLTATHGTLTKNADNSWSFSPEANYNGTVDLNYTVSDGNGVTVTTVEHFEITNANDLPSGEAKIEGRAQINETLTASATLVDIDGLGAFRYQWQADNVAINGATSSTYNITQNEVGKKITVQVIYTDTQGTEERVSSAATLSIAPNQNDSLVGTNDYDTLSGGYGDDEIIGLLRDDVLHGDQDNDTLYGDYGNDTLYGDSGEDTLYGGYGKDMLDGGEGNDLLFGEEGTDSLVGGLGNDILNGGVDDLMSDTLSGGIGNDTYYIGYGAVDVIIDNGLATDVDTVIMPYQLTVYRLPTGIENGEVTDGTQRAELSGNNTNNALKGNDGKNTLLGGLGDDTLIGGLGGDRVNGGSGNDTIFLDTANSQPAATALNGNPKGAGGSSSSSSNRNYSNAGPGNDTIIGSASIDVIDGNIGSDVLTGKEGADIFKFSTEPNASNIDTITDFTLGIDKINLSEKVFNALDKTTLAPGVFLSGNGAENALDNNDYLIYNTANGKLYYDADASGIASFPIQIALLGTTTHPVLTSSDFYVV